MSLKPVMLAVFGVGVFALVFALLSSFTATTDTAAFHGAAYAQTADTPTPTPVPGPRNAKFLEEPGEMPAAFDVQAALQRALPAEGKQGLLKYPNLDSNLNRIVASVESGASAAKSGASQAPIHRGDTVAVTLLITKGYADDMSAWLTANGADPRNAGADYIEAYIPVSLLGAASQQAGVRSIRAIIPPQPAQGTIISEGRALHGADDWNNAGYTGGGIKIGIIDNGFEDYGSLMGSELASSVTARCYTGVGQHTSNRSDCENGNVHGTAVTEAIFDIAPDAIYYIANPPSWSDLQSTVNWMVSNGVDIINHSVGWVWSGYGDGSYWSGWGNNPLKSVDTAVTGGITWLNSAGNNARATWYGAFRDNNDDNLHQFTSSADSECNTVQLTAGEQFIAMLRWNDSWGGADIDLDLYLISILGVIASSTEPQSGGANHIPLELIVFNPPASGDYCLAIEHFDGAEPSWLQLQAFSNETLNYRTASRSIGNPAESDNSGMLAVGATRYNNTSTIENFSSRGPTPGGDTKPDIVGVDGGNTSSYGRFYGTSQASPHLAGLAALVNERFPNYSPSQIANYLKNNAASRGNSRPNNTWGYGFASLPNDVDAPTPTHTPMTIVPTPTHTPTPIAIVPTPTDTPTPTPTATATPVPVVCVVDIADSAAISGSWSSACLSGVPAPDGPGDRYARFYSFTYSASGSIDIKLESSTDAYLYLRSGKGMSGAAVAENDDIDTRRGNYNSAISQTLDAGDYTIEATTYSPNRGGDFTLTVEFAAAVAPIPTPTATAPTPEPTLTPTARQSDIAAGANHVCSLSAAGEISCDGLDDANQVSNAPDGEGYTTISVGGAHSCALDTHGSIACWGSDDFKQVSDAPLETGFVAISAGGAHTCALDADGSAQCWGDNTLGQTEPPEQDGFIALVSGDNYTCALTAEFGRVCWGRFAPPEPTTSAPSTPRR